MPSKSNYISPEQFEKILEAIPRLGIRKWLDSDIQMLMKICYWCALRFNEGARLKVEDFNLKNLEIFLGKTKTNKEDIATIPPSFVQELSNFLEGKQGPLFPGLEYQTAIKWIYRLGKMLDIKAWTTPQRITGEKTKTHIFRKSISKDLYLGTWTEQKAPLNVVSKKLRHKGRNPAGTTWQYLKLDTEDVKEWENQNRL